jgi:hypothetical protein
MWSPTFYLIRPLQTAAKLWFLLVNHAVAAQRNDLFYFSTCAGQEGDLNLSSSRYYFAASFLACPSYLFHCKFFRQIPFFLYDFSNSTVLPAGWGLPQTCESTDICLQLQISQFSRDGGRGPPWATASSLDLVPTPSAAPQVQSPALTS